MSNSDRMNRAIGLLRDGLQPACEQTWEAMIGDDWLSTVNNQLHQPDRKPKTSDLAFLLNGILATWDSVFSVAFAPGVRAWVFEVKEARNKHAHNENFSTDDTLRVLDTMERLLQEFGDSEQRKKIKTLRRELTRQQYEEEARSDRRKTAAKPTETDATSGLAPWRDLVAPHSDVAAGQFEQAEFAADLIEVAKGTADDEYQDPEAFFRRTYLTQGLKKLLTGAAQRLGGGGGDPVIELQTNFGGGKTHSMIALYHLASGASVTEMPGVDEMLTEASISLPDKINRAVFVGQSVSPSARQKVEKGVVISTVWGHIAYQLGGKAGYEMVRADDEAGTNPGRKLKEVFEKFGPAVVLIDEWVAYARQLNDGGDGPRLAGGDFDTQFTFAQNLTETAAAVDNVVVLISIPASDIEVGGDKGQQALERLKNVVVRVAATWQPASPEESFEIVRRRLFDPITDDNARIRDGVVGAFAEMYRTKPQDFPSGTGENDYRRRLEQCYPVHPELFDRLFDDWSALDKFQRTRGVLRLMAAVISELWQRGDQSLLIMPGNLPIDSSPVVSELTKYLEEGWDPVIKSDVDGENALPLRIDADNKHFGQLSATRRAARTVYMGSAPRADGTRGVDLKSVILGCTQPGEPATQFADALKRLSGDATHLYVNGAQYWYSLQPNVTRIAADRAASNFNDDDADDEIRRHITTTNAHQPFDTLQVFAEGPGDVPDENTGVRLVILPPHTTHSGNDPDSVAITLANNILNQRSSGPRLNRNMLVFLAAASNRIGDLRTAVRSHLAWKSVVEDREALNLDAHQERQAHTKVDETKAALTAQIEETFHHILTPTQQPGTPDITWTTAKPTGKGDLVQRVANKLETEEQLISGYAGVRIRMDIDRFNLWTDRSDISINDLWTAYCQYPYMARLTSYKAFAEAVSKGLSNMNWAAETYAYAQAHNDDTWVGITSGQHVEITLSGLLLHPEFVPEPETPEPKPGPGDNPQPTPKESGPTKYFAAFDLEHPKALQQLNDILEHVANHLGTNIELTVELRATTDEPYTDATRRTVNENASNLKATGNEFE